LLGALRKWREARAIRKSDRQEDVSSRSIAVQNGVVFCGGEGDLLR
jgi:hypothetical protein